MSEESDYGYNDILERSRVVARWALVLVLIGNLYYHCSWSCTFLAIVYAVATWYAVIGMSWWVAALVSTNRRVRAERELERLERESRE